MFWFNVSDIGDSSSEDEDMFVPVSASSIPGRGMYSFGDSSNITGEGGLLSEFSFEDDSDGVVNTDSKKPRLGG